MKRDKRNIGKDSVPIEHLCPECCGTTWVQGKKGLEKCSACRGTGIVVPTVEREQKQETRRYTR